MKTAHEWAIELTHQRIHYGSLLEEKTDPEIVRLLKQAIFRSAKELIAEVQADARYPDPPAEPVCCEPGDVPAQTVEAKP